MYNLRPIRRLTRCFLTIDTINKIDLCMTGIEAYSYLSPVSHFGQSNISKSVLYVKKLAVAQQIIFNKSMINQKRSLVIII